MIRYAIITAAIFEVLWFALIAWCDWGFDPGSWTPQRRGVVAFVSIFGGWLFAGLVVATYNYNERHSYD